MKRITAFLPLVGIAVGIFLISAGEGPEDLTPTMTAREEAEVEQKGFWPNVSRLGEGWEEAFEPEEFGPGELYAKINGGAEVYLEHGFQQLKVFSFLHNEGDYIELFLFDQGDEARFMYEFEQPEVVEELERFGGYFAGPSLLMLKDTFYVKIQAAADTPRTREAVEALGDMVREGESL